MLQIMNETGWEVKSQMVEIGEIKYPKKDVVHRYVKRTAQEVLKALRRKTDAECMEIIRRVGDIKMFPGTNLTSKEEVGRFFDIDFSNTLLRSIKYSLGGADIVKKCMPVWKAAAFNAMINKVSPDVNKYRSGDYMYFETEAGKAIRGYNVKSPGFFQTVTPQGVILIAYHLANGRSEDRRRVAKLVVDAAEASGIWEKKCNRKVEKSAKEIKPLEPQEFTKIDPGKTAIQMFEAILALYAKEAEERGAEKVIQKLKEEGKL